MSLILAPQGNSVGVSMAPIVHSIRADLMDALESTKSAMKPKPPRKRKAVE